MDNPLKKIFNKATDLFKKTVEAGGVVSALGIDIGTSAIKVVEVKKKGGRAMLETYGSIALGPYNDKELGEVTNLPAEKIVEALKEVLKQSGVTNKVGVLSVPVQSSLVFSLELPAQITKAEMAPIVKIEARKYIPVPIKEVTLDFFEIPQKQPSFEEANNPELIKEKEEKKEILAIAIQNDAISKLRAITSSAELESDFFEVEIFSSVRACLEHELSLVILVDFGAARTKLTFVEFGIVKNYHTINRGGANITSSISKSLSVPFAKAEELKKEFGLFDNPTEKELASVIQTHTDYIFSEINSVLLKYEKKYNRTVSKIIFTGGGSMLKGLKEEAASSFKAEIKMAHPFSKLGSPAFLDKVLDGMGPEFAVAIGLALRKLQ